jgi:hypothetical protein
MAQVMTRGMVKSRFIIQWAIRSQVPSINIGMQFIDYTVVGIISNNNA